MNREITYLPSRGRPEVHTLRLDEEHFDTISINVTPAEMAEITALQPAWTHWNDACLEWFLKQTDQRRGELLDLH